MPLPYGRPEVCEHDDGLPFDQDAPAETASDPESTGEHDTARAAFEDVSVHDARDDEVVEAQLVVDTDAHAVVDLSEQEGAAARDDEGERESREARPGPGASTGSPRPPQVPAVRSPVHPGLESGVLGAVEEIRLELADRDEELRDVLQRLGDLYGRIADSQQRMAGAPAPAAPAATAGTAGTAKPDGAGDDRAARALLRSVDGLAAVTEASIDRIADMSRTVERLVESNQGVAARLDRIARRADESEAKLERLLSVVEGLEDDMSLLVEDVTGAPPPRPRRLRAVSSAQARRTE